MIPDPARCETQRIAELEARVQALEAELAARDRGLELEAERLASELERERNFAESLIGHLPCSFSFTDLDGVYRRVNTVAATMMGCGPEDLLGRRSQDVFPDNRAVIEEMRERVIGHGEVITRAAVPVRLHGQGPQTYWEVTSAPVRDAAGQVIGMVMVGLEVSERLKLERALREQKALLERIVQEAPAAIAFLAPDLTFQWNNPAHERLVGRPASQIIGRHVTEVVTNAEHSFGESYRRVLEELEAVHVSARPVSLRTDGVVDAYWDASYVPILTDDGTALGILVVGVDATERIGFERLQAAQIERLQQLDALKDNFLAVLSHELRTPINAIMAFGSVLEDEVAGPLNQAQHQYAQRILSGADILLALIDDLLDMSRIQAGKFTLSKAPMQLHDTASRVFAQLSMLAERKGQQLEFAIPRGLPLLEADDQRVGQVLTNLVGNAIKFTPEGGTIAVTARQTAAGVRCEVRDSGESIAPDDLPRLFERFSQLDYGNTRKATGTGLGLSIVKALIEAHGGAVGVESQVGLGSLFWFELPLA